MKAYADAKRRTHFPDISVGDTVVVKPPKIHSRLDPPYETTPYTVVAKKHSMISATKPGKTITRNSSFFKKIDPKFRAIVQDDDKLYGRWGGNGRW